jgi:hypothetical protein
MNARSNARTRCSIISLRDARDGDYDALTGTANRHHLRQVAEKLETGERTRRAGRCA